MVNNTLNFSQLKVFVRILIKYIYTIDQFYLKQIKKELIAVQKNF